MCTCMCALFSWACVDMSRAMLGSAKVKRGVFGGCWEEKAGAVRGAATGTGTADGDQLGAPPCNGGEGRVPGTPVWSVSARPSSLQSLEFLGALWGSAPAWKVLWDASVPWCCCGVQRRGLGSGPHPACSLSGDMH